MGNVGRKADWSGEDPKTIRDEIRAIQEQVVTLRDQIVGQCLRHLTHWAGSRVLAEARERRRSGRLEFHDLLVLARDLLARSEDTRATLHERYQRLLLDEFQDTDPIQIELAVRIAGGRDAVSRAVGGRRRSRRPALRGRRRQAVDLPLPPRQHQDLPRRPGRDRRPATLSTNFRSGPAVIDWVNEVFGQLITFEPMDSLPTSLSSPTAPSTRACTVRPSRSSARR